MADYAPITDQSDPRLQQDFPATDSPSKPQVDLSNLPDPGPAAAPAAGGIDLSGLPDKTGPRGGSHQDLVTQGLLDHGVKPVAAAAILGDIQQESNFDPHNVSDHGTSFGLLQVGGPMFRQFNADQAAQGINPGDPAYVYNQAPFVINKFAQQHPDRYAAMQNAPDAPTALKIFRSTPDWGYGIAGKRYQYAQDYQQALAGAPVQNVDTYTRVEKAVPVTETEHEVARAYPVSGPRPPLPKGPDTLNAPALPNVDLSGLPDPGTPPGVAPASIAAPEGNFPLATALVPPQFTNFMPQQVAPTESGKLPAQPPPDIFASPEAYAQSLSTGQDFTPAEMDRANKLWQTRLVNLPKVKEGDISASGQKLSSFDAATVNMARGFASGLTSMEGLFGLIPPVGLAEMLTNAPHLIDAVHAAEQTPAWSQDRWEAGLNVITSLAGAGLLGKATIEAGIAGMPKAEAKPGTSVGPAAEAAPTGEAASAAPTGDAGAAPAGDAAAPPEGGAKTRGGAVPSEGAVPRGAPPFGGGAGEPAGGISGAPSFDNVAEELKWLKQNGHTDAFRRRVLEEIHLRRVGKYPDPTEGTWTKPTDAPPETEAAPEEPAAAAPTAAAPEPAAERHRAGKRRQYPQPGGPIVRRAITEELAARGVSPAQIAALSAGQAANLVLQPAPDEIAAGTAATTVQPSAVAAGVSPAAPTPDASILADYPTRDRQQQQPPPPHPSRPPRPRPKPATTPFTPMSHCRRSPFQKTCRNLKPARMRTASWNHWPANPSGQAWRRCNFGGA